MLLLALMANADAVEVDGIYYNLIQKIKSAEVTSMPNDNYYTGEVTIPPKIIYEGIEYNVTSIGNNAFNNCLELTSVTIPNSVTSIGEYAFCRCMEIESISIPNSVTSIGSGAFLDCYDLVSINIPNGVSSINYGTFSYCSSLASITIPNNVKVIGQSSFAFSGLNSLIEYIKH